MSKISMNLTSSNGAWLNDCLQPQHYYVSIEIKGPEHQMIARVALSYEQAAKMMLYNGEVDCTLERYVNQNGLLVEEKVEPPQTVNQRMRERLKDTRETLGNRLENIRRDVYEMLNEGKANKKSLATLLGDIETIQSHYVANENFVMQQAEEELGVMQNNAAGQLGLFLQSHGANLEQEELKKLFSPSVPLLTDNVKPVKDDYEMKERQDRPIEQMTALEVADCISELFQMFEKNEKNDSDKHKLKLFHSKVYFSKPNKVTIKYIDYHSPTSLCLEEAKEYLKFLRSINNIKQFKTHFRFKIT